jgi:hypothetical protein
MSNTDVKVFKFADLFVIVFFLSTAFASFYLFQMDLFQTLSKKNDDPVGIILLKNNIVQRRMSDRVLWDRLNKESSVYLGDLIRVADLSAVILGIDQNEITLNENTLIRIQKSSESGFTIELSSGSLELASSANSEGITINLMGTEIKASAGTSLKASADNDGKIIQVSGGSAVLIDNGRVRELSEGSAIATDSNGNERIIPSVIVSSPPQNAHYLNSNINFLTVAFSWNRINMNPEDTVVLEVAEDRNFNRIFSTIEGLSTNAAVNLREGYWNWRLSHNGIMLEKGSFTITAASGPELISPSDNTVFYYSNEFPNLTFQWAETDNASYYIFEASTRQDFINPQISRQLTATSFAQQNMEGGTWYWRVLPIFPPVYKGNASFSNVSSFRIEQGYELANSVIEVPDTVVHARFSLEQPAPGARINGLTALRESVTFNWDCEAIEIEKSRFVVSRNAASLREKPEIEINNPGRSLKLEKLMEGKWYWTIEVKIPGKDMVYFADVQSFTVDPITLLPSPLNRRPVTGFILGINELRSKRSIDFSWQAVNGANAYIFSLYQQTANGRRLVQRTIENQTSWTLNNIQLLDNRGTFIWQVEAVNRRGGIVEQHGIAAENTFTVNIPIPQKVQLDDTGILYGN